MSGNPARAAILGLGLVGGSLGLALKQAWPQTTITGYDAADGVAERARARGAIDQVANSVSGALPGAGLVVIAAPTLAAEGLLREIAAGWDTLAPDGVITDVCSVKAPVLAWAEALLPVPARFAGSHPMAGSERAGIEAASASLFAGARWVITPCATTAPNITAQVRALARAVSARPLVMDAARHDDAVAGVSHLPLVAASALAQTLAESPDWELAADLAAGGYRDTTRVAAGDPIMGRDMLLANRARIAPRLRAYIVALEQLEAAIRAGDGPAIEAALRAASAARRAWAARVTPIA